jgi:hypothetical protein
LRRPAHLWIPIGGVAPFGSNGPQSWGFGHLGWEWFFASLVFNLRLNLWLEKCDFEKNFWFV